MKALLIAAFALASISVAACKAPAAQVACTLTSATSKIACMVDGVTVIAPIPPDVATIIGIGAPFTGGVVTAQSVSRAGEPVPETCTYERKTLTATCTNTATHKSATFPFPG